MLQSVPMQFPHMLEPLPAPTSDDAEQLAAFGFNRLIVHSLLDAPPGTVRSSDPDSGYLPLYPGHATDPGVLRGGIGQTYRHDTNSYRLTASFDIPQENEVMGFVGYDSTLKRDPVGDEPMHGSVERVNIPDYDEYHRVMCVLEEDGAAEEEISRQEEALGVQRTTVGPEEVKRLGALIRNMVTTRTS